MIPNGEILKYFFENDYKEYVRLQWSSQRGIDRTIDLTQFIDNEIAFLIHCLDNLGQLTLYQALLPESYLYFPELNDWLPNV